MLLMAITDGGKLYSSRIRKSERRNLLRESWLQTKGVQYMAEQDLFGIEMFPTSKWWPIWVSEACNSTMTIENARFEFDTYF